MGLNKNYIFFSLLALIFSHPFQFCFGQAKTYSGLNINQTTIWSGVINIEGDIIVSSTGLLIIEAGTRIYFDAQTDKQKSGQDPTRCELIVQGLLIAKGEADKKIVFTSRASSPRMGDWYGISIASSRTGTEIEQAVIEYAYQGLTIKKSSPQIKNSQIRYNYYSGLTIEIKSEPKLLSNIISENGYAGIVCRLASNPLLSDNIITLNQIGLIIFGNSKPNLGSLVADDNFNIGRNAIIDNQEFNIHNHSSESIMAENNSWGTTSLAEIANQIFDATDEPKYGTVDFNPILQSQEQVGQRILGRQFSMSTARVSTPSQPVQNETVNQTRVRIAQVNSNTLEQSPVVLNQQTANPETVTPTITQTDSANTKEVQVTQNLSETSTLIASQETKVSEELSLKKEPATEEPPEVKIDYEQIFLDAFLDQKKEVTRRVAPTITDKSKGMNAKGDIIIRVVVNKLGRVDSAQILRGLNYYYDEISLTAAQKFEFKPGTINTIPVRFSTVLVFKF